MTDSESIAFTVETEEGTVRAVVSQARFQNSASRPCARG